MGFGVILGRRLRWAVATRVRATSARMESASPRRGGTAASCTGSMALSVRGFEEAAAAPLSAASKRPGARQRNEGCSGASPGTQRKRVVSSNSPLGQRYSGLSARGERLGFGTRPPPCLPAEAPSGIPTSPATAAHEGGTRTPLSCALCEPQRAPQIAPRRRYQLASAATRSLASRQDRRRAAGAAPSFCPPETTHTAPRRRSDRWTRTTPKNKYAPQSKGPRLYMRRSKKKQGHSGEGQARTSA